MPTQIVTIDLGHHDYDIYIGEGTLYRIHDFIPESLEGRSTFIITDENVETYARKIADILTAEGAVRSEILVLPAGEATKSFGFYQHACEWLLEQKISRDSIVLAVGGGVIGDLTGFVAASIMRGVSYIQVPTSLLAQVDSSVGGKTGINTIHGKNLVGSFYQPDAVIADIDVLKTLPKRELLAGYAEVAKYGLIDDEGFFEWLEERGQDVCSLNPVAIAHAIETSTKAKAALVIADEKEHGRRALLNLGHTFGHALEAVAGYDGRLLHGEAVAMGIVMAFDLSSRLGLCPREDYERVEQHFISVGLPTRASFINPALGADAERLMQLMYNDKKVKRGKINFILVKKIGEAFITSDVPMNMVEDVIANSLGITSNSDNEVLMEQWKSAFSSQ